jgi:hypothetical protein
MAVVSGPADMAELPQLRAMFPQVPTATLQQVLASHAGHTGMAIDALFGLQSDAEQDEDRRLARTAASLAVAAAAAIPAVAATTATHAHAAAAVPVPPPPRPPRTVSAATRRVYTPVRPRGRSNRT